MPGHGPLAEGAVPAGAALDPELEPVPEDDEPELFVDVFDVDPAGAEVLDDEPEFDVDVVGDVELDVAAKATVVPAPASTPESNSPATICLVRSFMDTTSSVSSLFGTGRSWRTHPRGRCEDTKRGIRTARQFHDAASSNSKGIHS